MYSSVNCDETVVVFRFDCSAVLDQLGELGRES